LNKEHCKKFQFLLSIIISVNEEWVKGGVKMIYTVTLNPAIDLFIRTKEMKPSIVNRTEEYDIQANGKGVNVSFILQKLGIKSTAVGIGGGFTFSYIEEELQKKNIATHFFKTTGLTRINVFTRVENDDAEYKLVNDGPTVNDAEKEEFLNYFEKLAENDLVCISGSFAKGINPSILTIIAQIVQKRKAKLIVDTSYKEVLDILPFHPLLIKPNEEELTDWFDLQEVPKEKQLIKMAQKLITKGAQNVLLSLGADGAILITKDKIYKGNAPKIEVLNTACSGDSMLGTFIAGIEKKMSLEDNLKASIAAGSDTARMEWITDFVNTKELEKQIKIINLEGGKEND
jgi:1-phosphofructokinase